MDQSTILMKVPTSRVLRLARQALKTHKESENLFLEQTARKFATKYNRKWNNRLLRRSISPEEALTRLVNNDYVVWDAVDFELSLAERQEEERYLVTLIALFESLEKQKVTEVEIDQRTFKAISP